MKYSFQREEIRKCVIANKIHPTADEVYSIVRKNNPNISLGTVYRNLNILSQRGIVNKISMPEGSDRFDSNTYPHYHVICEVCAKICDVDLEIMSNLNQTVKEQSGFIVNNHHLIIYGVCSDCNNQQKS